MFHVYTDGACEPNPGKGGWGFVVYSNGMEVHAACGGELITTNNRMEFSGILMAMRWLGPKAAMIHTDSMYCLNALTKWHHKWAQNYWRKGTGKNAEPVKNAELIRECLAAKHKGHTFKWCKGHSGIVGNERADRLAATGRSGVGKVVEVAPVDTQIIVSNEDEIHARTHSQIYVPHCGCTHVQPWEDCEHTDAMSAAAAAEMLA